MRILAQKKFLFEVEGASFLTDPQVIQDMPDAFAQSLMFRMAKNAGDVQVLDTLPTLRAAENDPGKPARRASRRAAARATEAGEKEG